MSYSLSKNIQLFVDYDCWQKINKPQAQNEIIQKSADNIIAEIKRYVTQYGAKRFEFLSYCNLNLKDLSRFCSLVMRHKIRVTWSSPAIINTHLNDIILKKMKEAGCEKLIFDLFCGSDTLLNKMNAAFTTNQAKAVFKACHTLGIATGVNIILGHPGETQADFDNTLSFLDNNRLFIDEITGITWCLSSYLYSHFYPLPLCKNWFRCLGTNIISMPEVCALDFNACLSKLSNLDIPIRYIEHGQVAFEYLKELDNYLLKRRKLSFCFDQGKGRLFWKGLELTSGLGMYTSIYASGFWQDSEHAEWEVTKVHETKMVMKGNWPTLPVTQIWQIELKDETTFDVKIDMEVLDKVTIEGEQQVNLMLNSK